MKKIVCAVTVSKNYLERTKYSIKYLTIGKRRTDVPFWFVRHVGETSVDSVMLTGIALKYAYDNNIPFFRNVRHGECVDVDQQKRLKKYGVAVK